MTTFDEDGSAKDSHLTIEPDRERSTLNVSGALLVIALGALTWWAYF